MVTAYIYIIYSHTIVQCIVSRVYCSIDFLGQGNDVVLRLKTGKIVINPIPPLMYSIRPQKHLPNCSHLNRWRKWFFEPHPFEPWENFNFLLYLKNVTYTH